MANAYDSTVITFLITAIVTLVAEILFAIMSGFMGIILGHKSNNKRILKSIVFGFLAYMIPSAFTLAVIFGIGLFNPDVMNLFNTTESLDVNTIKTILHGGIIMYTLYSILYYFLGKRQFEKGVNVE